MIKIENLVKKFTTTEVETIALNNVNLEVADKEFVALWMRQVNPAEHHGTVG